MVERPAESDEDERAESGPLADDSRRCGLYGSAERRARQRQRYLDAVIETIRTIGADATMAELAAGAGVSKPVLYTHFGDRLGLTTAVVTRLADISAADRRANRENEPPDLADLIDGFVHFVEQNPEIYRWALRCTPDQSELLRHLVPATIQGKQLHSLVEAAADGAPETADVTSIAIAGFAVTAVDLWLARRSITRDHLVTYLSRFVAEGLGASKR